MDAYYRKNQEILKKLKIKNLLNKIINLLKILDLCIKISKKKYTLILKMKIINQKIMKI